MLGTENRREVTLMVSLRELRAERLLSIRELARRASIAPSTVFLIEAGRSIPRQRVARQLAEVLGVDPMIIDELRRHIDAAKLPRTDGQGTRGTIPSMETRT